MYEDMCREGADCRTSLYCIYITGGQRPYRATLRIDAFRVYWGILFCIENARNKMESYAEENILAGFLQYDVD